jgi:hypothetical protein
VAAVLECYFTDFQQLLDQFGACVGLVFLRLLNGRTITYRGSRGIRHRENSISSNCPKRKNVMSRVGFLFAIQSIWTIPKQLHAPSIKPKHLANLAIGGASPAKGER